MGVPHAHAAGSDSDRILIFGAGAAVGWGVTTHDLALPGALARALAETTARGADVDVVVDSSMTVARAATALRAVNLARYDAIVVVLGVNDALQLTSPVVWRNQLSTVLAVVSEISRRDTTSIVAGIQPIRSIPIFDSLPGALADRHAAALNAESMTLCAASSHAVFVQLPVTQRSTSPDRHRAPDEYAQWGRLLADSLTPLLATHHRTRALRRSEGFVSVTEAKRQDAVDGLMLHDDGSLARLTDILTFAQRAFRAESATITVLDHGRQRYLAQVGAELREISRTDSFCNTAIGGEGAMIVRDALGDERFKDNPIARVQSRIRFYAGFPIELQSGERIGTLCVVDSRARRPDERIDEILLRELALMAQRELWRR